MVKLAIYDMDRTLTRKPTVAPFLIHACWRIAPWRLLLAPALLVAVLGYYARLIDRARLKEISVAVMVGRTLPEHIAPSLADETIAGNILPKALAQIEADRAAGYRQLLATASLRFYSAEIARRLGIEHIVATDNLRRADGSMSNRIDGENCYGSAKLRKIEAWMADNHIARSQAHIRFYSDHVSDAPVLDFADEPFATNPHAALEKLAQQRGWPILDWR